VKCPECDGKLVDYLYNELSPEERRKMDEHFKICENCVKQLSQLKFVHTSFQQLTKQEPGSLVHQRILAHAKDISLQERGSWLTRWLFRPSTATAMVALLAIGIFYYTQQYTPLETSTEKVIVKAEPVASETDREKKIERAPSDIPLDSEEILLAKAKPPATAGGGIYQEQQGVLTLVAKTLPEEKERSLALSIPSKNALYAFELGNLYFSQNEFEEAIANYSIALTMSPREAYTSIIRYQLALSYKNLNDCTSAVQVLDEIQKINPQYPEIDKVFIMAGDCYLDLQAYDKAEINYTNFISQFPDRKSQVDDKLETARNFRRVNLSY